MEAQTEPSEPRTAAPAPVEAQPPPLPPPPPHAVLNETIRAAREQGQRALLWPNEPSQPDLPPLPEGPLPGAEQPVPPEGLPGFFTPLELPKGAEPLARLEAALAELEAGEADGPVRVAFYGASAVSADLWTGYVRAYLRARFGDGGPGIVAAASPTPWYRHHELEVERSKRGWTKHNSYRLKGEDDPGYFGVMGQAMSSNSKKAWAEIAPRDRSPSAEQLAFYQVDYLVQPKGGSFRLLLDGEQIAEVSTRTPAPVPKSEGETEGETGDASEGKGAEARVAPAFRRGREQVDLEPGAAHRLRIEIVGDGPVRLLGVIAETGQPGIVLDTLGVNGAKTSNQAVWDEALWSEHLRSREPVLYVLAFGNNESVDEELTPAAYEADYRAALERFARALPDASCVMVGPGDFPRVGEDGELRNRPRLDRIREVQRRLAGEYGCAFYDALSFFGGRGSKAAWVEAGLGKDDYLHLTRLGYLRFGIGIGDALMQGYDWRAQHQREGELAPR